MYETYITTALWAIRSRSVARSAAPWATATSGSSSMCGSHAKVSDTRERIGGMRRVGTHQEDVHQLPPAQPSSSHGDLTRIESSAR